MFQGGDNLGTIVADIGSQNVRIGFAGDDSPVSFYPTPVGYLESPEREIIISPSKYRENMKIKSPIYDGNIIDWDLLEYTYNYSFNNILKTDPSTSPLLIAEKPYILPSDRHKLAEFVFEKFRTPALFFSKDSVLSCYACGKTSGLVIDCGSSGTLVSPVNEGWVDSKALSRSSVGGRLMDAYMFSLLTKKLKSKPRTLYKIKKLFNDKGSELIVQNIELSDLSSFDSFMNLELARDVKESICKVAEYNLIETESKYFNLPLSSYELPDGTNVDLGIERFHVPELLFDTTNVDLRNPELIKFYSDYNISSESLSVSPDSIPKIVYDSLSRCDSDNLSTILPNIILTGGSSAFDGFQERLKLEIERVIAPGTKVRIISTGTSERTICPWLGGSILGSLGSFNELWVSKAEYEEYGPSIIDKKCP